MFKVTEKILVRSFIQLQSFWCIENNEAIFFESEIVLYGALPTFGEHV